MIELLNRSTTVALHITVPSCICEVAKVRQLWQYKGDTIIRKILQVGHMPLVPTPTQFICLYKH